MGIEWFNPKEEIKKFIADHFVKRVTKGLVIKRDNFIDFLEGLNKIGDETDGKKFYILMSSIIGDVYEALLWQHALEKNDERDANLLSELDESKSLMEAIDRVLSEDNCKVFLASIRASYDFSFADRISARNNLYSVETNQQIMHEDTFRLIEDLYFRQRKLIFSKKYQKDEFLSLYDRLQPEYEDEDSCMEAFVDIIYGLHLYNHINYEKLILDMCMEFFVQKQLLNDLDKDYMEEEYLLFLIKYADTSHILEVISQQPNVLRALVVSYSSYDYFEQSDRTQASEHITPDAQKIIKKLHKERNEKS